MRDCDFIPPAYHQKHELACCIRQRVSVIGGMLILIIAWWVVHQGRLASASAMMRDICEQSEQLQVHVQKKQAMEAERARLERREALVESLFSPTRLGVVFADISDRVPGAIILTDLRVRSPGLTRYIGHPEIVPIEKVPKPSTPPTTVVVDAPKPAEHARLTIAGLARKPQEVISFAAALERSPLLDRVQIQSQGFTQWAGRNGEKFEIVCDLVDQGGPAK